MNDIPINKNILRTFQVNTRPILLSGGEGRTYKANNTILKHVNKDSKEYWDWIARLFNSIQENGFRISKPIKSKNNEWVTPEGWMAWTAVEGAHHYENQIPQIIEAIISFHKSIDNVKVPSFLDQDTPYKRADTYAWGDKPKYIDPQVKEMVDRLYRLRKSIHNLTDQLIHGDLNPDNILVSPHLPPAIIDFAPYWRPIEFSLAVFAFWIGPWRNKPEYLKFFKKIKEFDQMLIRAGIRMLLIMSEFGRVTELQRYKSTSKLIISHVSKVHSML